MGFPVTGISQTRGYAAREGREDRHGEMTGAISVNMFLSMVPVGVWSMFVGPWLTDASNTLKIALLMAVVLPLYCLPLSRRLWVRLSAWAETLG